MKKSKFYLAFMAVMMLLACTAFTACSDDDDENDAPETVTVMPSVGYSVAYNEELLSLVDIKVTYWDQDGNQAEAILDESNTVPTTSDTGETIVTWAAAFDLDADRSQKVGYSVSYTAKPDLESKLESIEGEAITVTSGHGYTYVIVDGDGNEISYHPLNITATTRTFEKSRLMEFLANNRAYSWEAEYDAAAKRFVE